MGRKKPRKVRTPRRDAPPRPELNVAGRAQLGPDAERRPYRPREDDASIEDPLQDWPKEE